MEFQALIAYACNISFYLGGWCVDDRIHDEKLMMKLCFGNDNDNDDEMVCYVDQLLLGLNKLYMLRHLVVRLILMQKFLQNCMVLHPHIVRERYTL
jgi:hypothetical protein